MQAKTNQQAARLSEAQQIVLRSIAAKDGLHNTAQRARTVHTLRHKGLIARAGYRDPWEITEAGRNALATAGA